MTAKTEAPPKKAKYGQIVAVKRTGEDAEGVPFPLCKFTCVIGRSEDADIRLHLASVSLKHCIISVNPDTEEVSLETFATIIPSYLNENPLERNSKVPLKHGDVISVANRRFRFEYLPPNFTPKQVSVTPTPVATQEAPKTPEPASQVTEISSAPLASESRPEIIVKIFTPVAKPPVTGILRRRSSITPALPSQTIENTIVGSTPNAKASAAKADTNQPVSTSSKDSSASEDRDQHQTQEEASLPETTESQTSTILSTPAPKRVSFGPYLSPEQYDSKLPPVTPVKRGATPSRASLARSKLASTAESVIEEDERESTLESDNPDDSANDSLSKLEAEGEMESPDLFNTTADSGSSDLLNVSEEIDISTEEPRVSGVTSPDSSNMEDSETPKREVSPQGDDKEVDLSLSQPDLSPVADSSMLSSTSLLSPKAKPPAQKVSPISSPEPQIKLHIESDSPPNPVQVKESSENAEAEKSPDDTAAEEPLDNTVAEESSGNVAVEEPSQDPIVIEEPVQEELVSTESADMETSQGDLFNETGKEAVNDLTLDSEKVPSPAGAEEEVKDDPDSDTEYSESSMVVFIAEDIPLPEPCVVSLVRLETSEIPETKMSQENVESETSTQSNSDAEKENPIQETSQPEEPADVSVVSAEIPEIPEAISETAMDVDASQLASSDSVKESLTNETNQAEKNTTETTHAATEISQPPVDFEPEVAVEESSQETDATEAVPEAVPVDKPVESEKVEEGVSSPQAAPPTEGNSTPAEAVHPANQSEKKQRNRRKTPHEVKAISPTLEGVAELFNTPLSAKTVQRRRLDLGKSAEAQESPFRRSRRVLDHNTPKQAIVAVRRLTDEQVSAIQTELRMPTRGKPRAAKSIALVDLDPPTAKAAAGRSRKAATSKKVQEDKETNAEGVTKPEENVEEEAKPMKRSRGRKVSETSTEPDTESQPSKRLKKTAAVVVVPVQIPEIEDTHKDGSEEDDHEEVKETSKGKKASRGNRRKATKESDEDEELPVMKGKRGAKKPAKKDEDDDKIVEMEEAAPKRRAKQASKKEDEDLEAEEPAPKTRGNRRSKKVEENEEEETTEMEKPASKSRAQRNAKKDDVPEVIEVAENEKPAPKSRAKRNVKKEDVEVTEDEKPASKSRAKRSAKKQDVQEEEVESSENEKPAPKSRAKRGAKKDAEEEVEVIEEEKPAPKSRAKRNAKKEDVPEEEGSGSPPKRGRSSRQKTAETPSEPPTKPTPKRGKGAKANVNTKNGKEEDAEVVEEEAPSKGKPTRTTRGKVKDEEIEEEENASSTKPTKARSTKKNGKAKSEEAVGLDDVEMAHQHKGHAAHLHDEKLRSLEDSASSPRRVGTRRKVQIETPDEERPAPKRATRSRK